ICIYNLLHMENTEHPTVSPVTKTQLAYNFYWTTENLHRHHAFVLVE
uniref:Uncharacterized protein n=1 Tax=Anabas testudineus TaxID=64144 RepID=A0A7N6BGY7_ANATE